MTHSIAKPCRRRRTVVLAVLFVAVMLLVNVAFRGARLDLTQNHLYTLSRRHEEDPRLDRRADQSVLLSSPTRARRICRSCARTPRACARCSRRWRSRSGGKIKLELIDPLPFSEDEDRAASFGLQAVPVGAAGEKIFFGLAGTNSTNGQSMISFFQPDKEAFLEYDVAKLIHELSVAKKPVVGLLSSLPIDAAFDPQTRPDARSVGHRSADGRSCSTSAADAADAEVDRQGHQRARGRASEAAARRRAIRDRPVRAARRASARVRRSRRRVGPGRGRSDGRVWRRPRLGSRSVARCLGHRLRPAEGRRRCGACDDRVDARGRSGGAAPGGARAPRRQHGARRRRHRRTAARERDVRRRARGPQGQ